MMLSAQYTDNTDDVSNVKLVSVEKPVASSGMAVVKVIAAASNPIDVMVMKGFLKGAWSMPLPFSMGYDMAGVIDSLEGESGEFSVGDEVFCVNWGYGKHDEEGQPLGGSFSEYMLIPIKKLSKKPSELSFELAAAVALVGTTAYQIVYDVAKISSPDKKVVILGGSSAVGSIAVQLAKMRGAYVVTTCSTRNIDYVTPFGADKIVDYKKDKWYSINSADGTIKGFDAVIDTIGEQQAMENALSSGVLKEDGVFVTIANAAVGYNPAGHPPLSYAAFHCLSNNPSHQDELAAMVVSGALQLTIDDTYPFTIEGVHAMLKKMESGTSQGKNVLKIVV